VHCAEACLLKRLISFSLEPHGGPSPRAGTLQKKMLKPGPPTS
jgi:hypothetical protein